MLESNVYATILDVPLGFPVPTFETLRRTALDCAFNPIHASRAVTRKLPVFEERMIRLTGFEIHSNAIMSDDPAAAIHSLVVFSVGGHGAEP